MASAVADRVMGGAEQQKLHPYFGQYTKPCPTPPSPPLPPSHVSPPASCQDPTPGERAPIDSPSVTFQQNPVLAEPDTQEDARGDDPETHRRKRLKTSASAGTHADESISDIPQYAPADDPLVKASQSTTPPRKILKLNTNGKLLSSPPGSRTAHRETRGKPKKTAKKEKTRIITLKHKSKTVGHKIDAILRGLERYKPPGTSVTKPNVPPKATHPFFLKKSSSQPSREVTPSTTDDTETQQGPPQSKGLQKAAWQNQFSRSLLPKFPEPIAPIWPPRDLSHVRAVDGCPPCPSPVLLPDRKKNKERALGVDESENILRLQLPQVRSEMEALAEEPSVRLPQRYVASGRTLQKILNNELSYSRKSKSQHVPGYCGEPGRQHPAIAKLFTSIASSMTAFDIGQCESIQWAHKYAPVAADEVLQAGPEARMLRDWLKSLMISSVDTGNPNSGKKPTHSVGRKMKRRKAAKKLDGFVVSSEDEASEMSELADDDEDELAAGFINTSKRTVIRVGDSVGKFRKRENSRMTNALLISGPNGCGKSASVYAVAQELDFEVFEINSGNRRSAKDILERVGDMTQNHLIHIEGVERQANEPNNEPSPIDVKQNKLNSFFKTKATDKVSTQVTRQDNSNAQRKPGGESSRSQKQSLILLEEVDILFEEDKQFWMGVLALISQSKRPVIMTCNNEDMIPLQDLSLHAILRYRPPHPDVAVDYLLVLAANEGHVLQRESVTDLYSSCNQDLRKSIMELDFWCQMAVGSQKSGIDWILDRWSQDTDTDANGDKLKVISLNTYRRFMGWFSRDQMMIKNNLARETELLLEGMNWWQLEIDAEDEQRDITHPISSNNADSEPIETNLEQLQKAAISTDTRSAFDTLAHGWSLNQKEDDLDASISNLSDKQRSNYQEGYPLLNATYKADYTGLSASIGSTAQVLMKRNLFNDGQQEAEANARRVLAKQFRFKRTAFPNANYTGAFDDIMQSNDSILVHAASSSEFDIAGIVQDIAPYIRSIMAFDLRLEQYRLQLSGILSQGPGNKRMRTTRASRAALEGGDKSNTRRERWFSQEADPKRILATGSSDWQDALVQMGHFSVMPIALRGTSSSQSDSDQSEVVSRAET